MENTCTPNIKSSYTYEDLLASGRGELFGKEGPQLPAPKTAVHLVKGILKRN